MRKLSGALGYKSIRSLLTFQDKLVCVHVWVSMCVGVHVWVYMCVGVHVCGCACVGVQCYIVLALTHTCNCPMLGP